MRNFDSRRQRAGRSLVVTAVAGLTILACGCGMVGSSFPSDDSARPAQDTPPRFVAHSEEPGRCSPTMVDPRNGVHIELVRSNDGTRGDYAVPGDMYGVRFGQLLRLDCETGNVIGLVHR